MPRKSNEANWAKEAVAEHIRNGKLLYKQLSEESKRDIDDETEGSGRKAALQAKADAWRTANVLITEIAKLQERYEQAKTEGSILTDAEKQEDFKEGFSERMAN